MKRFLLSVAFFITLIRISLCQDTIKFQLVKDIYKGTMNENSSFIRYLTLFNDQFIFTAEGDFTGNELYISDGTNAGTYLIKNINTYHQNMKSEKDNSSYAEGMTVFGDKLIFCANDDIHGYEPWITDGTAIGTHLIKDMLPPHYGNNDGSNPRDFTEYHNKIYFTADAGLGDELYCTDGTEQGTNLVKDIYRLSSYPSGYIVFQDKLIFSAEDSLGTEPWVSDGTAEGTKVLKDINNSFLDSRPIHFTEYHNKLYFSAFVDSMGSELWETDGTETGTKLCRDINIKENAGSNPDQFSILNDRLYFIASDSSQGLQLWCTNGDSIFKVKCISPDPTAMTVGYTKMHVYNNRLYFGAMINAMSKFTLWTSDGTPEGTVELLASDSTFISDPQGFVNWHNQMIFMGEKQYTSNNQLWITDGTRQNTRQIFNDSITGWSPVKTIAPFTIGDDAFFVAQFVDSIGAELYKLVIDTAKDFPIGQDFASIGTEWYYTETFFSSGDINFLKIESVKDTVVKDVNCHKLVKTDYLICTGRSEDEIVYFEDSIAYFYDKKFDEFQVLFDLKAKKDSSWIIRTKNGEEVDTITVLVDSTDFISINSKELKRLYVTYKYSQSENVEDCQYSSQIIESIGDISYLFNIYPYWPLPCDENNSDGLRCYHDSNLGPYETGIAESCDYSHISTDIKDTKSEMSFNVYPNPASDRVKIEIDNNIEFEYVLMDPAGRRLQSKKFISSVEIDLSGYTKGVYIISLKKSGHVINTKKLVKY
jgi:ELWxxDGT repeat protein